jgi:catechol-2,3-dioxygenase
VPIQRLNHAVLYVRDAERSAEFYEGVLGFRRVPLADELPGAIFLQAPGSTNDHDLGLFSVGDRPGPGGIGLYHLAWEVDTLDELERISRALGDAGALTGASDHGTTKAIYAKDPDGIEFEVSWLVPKELVDDAAVEARGRIGRLDLAGEKARYGADTEGGVGVSHSPS